MRVLKGHATENDFVLIDDRDGVLELSPDLVRALCDRHAGIGADGVLRVVRSELDADAAAMASDAPYFMDYRNADGSLAEMCGNGARLFVRYLQSAGLVGERTAIATRGGVRAAWSQPDGSITIEMGQPTSVDARPYVRVRGAVEPVSGVALTIPNPHVVVSVPSEADLAGLDLTAPPVVEPPLPDGQNVEFVVRTGPRQLAMRVHERGVGETRSCGTGICAAVVAMAGPGGNDGQPWTVDLPGGRCVVRWRADGQVELTGPAQLVAEIDLDDAWLAAVSPRSAAVPG
jgi:diaminopimelate epimerase